jgi:hypothetical protein
MGSGSNRQRALSVIIQEAAGDRRSLRRRHICRSSPSRKYVFVGRGTVRLLKRIPCMLAEGSTLKSRTDGSKSTIWAPVGMKPSRVSVNMR